MIRESGINSLRVGDVYYVGHCRGSNAYGMRWQTIRFCWRCGGNQRRAAGMGTVASAAYYRRRRLNPDNE